MKVVFVVPDFEPLVGGTSRQVGYQARALAARGHEVSVLTRRWDRGLARREVRDGLSVVRVGPPGRGPLPEKAALLAVAAWLARRRRSVGVVQVLMQGDLATAVRLAGLLDRTCLTWAGLGDAADLLRPRAGGVLSGMQWRFRRAALSRVRHVALSSPIAEEVRSLGEPVAAQIPVPVDLSGFRPPSPAERDESRAALHAAPTETVVVYVGHLRALKAVDHLVDAFARFLATGRSGRLVLVGGDRGATDDTGGSLRDHVAAAGIGASVCFAGAVEDVRPYLWAGDLFVLPSEREGMPNTLLEAMASGLPCVAPASAGGDVLLTGGAGLVPDSNDPDDLLRALVDLADDPGLRARLRATALERVRSHGVDAVVDAYERLYNQVLAP